MLKNLKLNYKKQRKNFIKNRKTYRHFIDNSLKINYDLLSENAKKVLHFCSFLPSEMIMKSLLYSENTFNSNVWQELEELSLLFPLQNNTKSSLYYYNCYRLVQDFALKSINTKEVNNVLLDLVKIIIDKYKNISKEILHKDHCLANNINLQFQSIYEHLMKEKSNDNNNDIQLKLEFIEKTATHSWKYLRQASTVKKILSSELMEQLLLSAENQEENASIATWLNNIGLIYKNKGEFDEALIYYQKSLKIRCRILNINESQGNADIAQSLNNIGVVYYNKGEFDQALVYYQKALKIICRIFDIDESEIEIKGNASIAQSLNNIGSVYYYKEHYDEALAYYYKSFKIRCRVFDIDETKVEIEGNAAIATSLNNIGNVYDAKGEFDKVLMYYHKALKIRCRVFGVDESELETQGNVDIAQLLNNIGLVYNTKGDYDKALVYYYKSLKILFRIFDIDKSQLEFQGNTDIAEVLYNIASIYYTEDKFNEALIYYQKTLKILYRIFTNNLNHPFIKDTKIFIDICNTKIL